MLFLLVCNTYCIKSIEKSFKYHLWFFSFLSFLQFYELIQSIIFWKIKILEEKFYN